MSCPSTGTPLTGPGRYFVQGTEKFTTFTCGYSDGLHGFDLSLSYYPKETAAASLPAKGGRYCSSYQDKPYTIYSAGYYAYAQASGSPADWNAAFAYATGLLGQAAGVAHSCSTVSVTDKKPPVVQALPSQGTYPRVVKLKFRVSDDSGRAKVGAVVFQGRRPIYRFAYRWVTAKNGLSVFGWKPPAKFRSGVQLTFCVGAVDAVGHKSSDCANFSVLAP